jgi:hypothetical protein
MNTNKLKSNEIIGKRQLLNLKGGIDLPSTPAITIPVLSLEGGDETDKRAKRPGLSA